MYCVAMDFYRDLSKIWQLLQGRIQLPWLPLSQVRDNIDYEYLVDDQAATMCDLVMSYT